MLTLSPATNEKILSILRGKFLKLTVFYLCQHGGRIAENTTTDQFENAVTAALEYTTETILAFHGKLLASIAIGKHFLQRISRDEVEKLCSVAKDLVSKKMNHNHIFKLKVISARRLSFKICPMPTAPLRDAIRTWFLYCNSFLLNLKNWCFCPRSTCLMSRKLLKTVLKGMKL